MCTVMICKSLLEPDYYRSYNNRKGNFPSLFLWLADSTRKLIKELNKVNKHFFI